MGLTDPGSEVMIIEPRLGDLVSLRKSSIVSLAARGLLDAMQVGAAWRFRRLWEAGLDIHREHATYLERIDLIGRGGEVGQDHQPAAIEELKRCRVMLGVHGYRLVVQVCGYGYHIRDLHQHRRDRDTSTDMLRSYLTLLGELWINDPSN